MEINVWKLNFVFYPEARVSELFQNDSTILDVKNYIENMFSIPFDQ